MSEIERQESGAGFEENEWGNEDNTPKDKRHNTAKFAAIKPIIIALSAAKIISINIIWIIIINSSINVID